MHLGLTEEQSRGFAQRISEEYARQTIKQYNLSFKVDCFKMLILGSKLATYGENMTYEIHVIVINTYHSDLKL